ncbi:MAG: NAD(P)H-hydrate dehydratase [Bacteroidales bacterium]|jgi:NAD(P)H-hydrate epimerase|nr:NAD(P)H-hydrate dehydratase [Bacteroidales bacterium]
MIQILSPKEIKDADAYTICRKPIAAIELMEKAAAACTEWIAGHVKRDRKIVVFAGPGNNGGDGLAIARRLHALHYDVQVFLPITGVSLSDCTRLNLAELKNIRLEVTENGQFPELTSEHVVIDAMFGIGLTRPLTGIAAQAVAFIRQSPARVIAVDIPSGLFCEDNSLNPPDSILKADYTLTFQQPKLSFFFAENSSFTGKWEVLDIGLLTEKATSQHYMLSEEDIKSLFAPRKKFSHKGDYGHACIIAGSRGMMGAAVLAVKACLRSGAGLVTAHVPQDERLSIQLSAPEALVSADEHPQVWSQAPDLKHYTAAAIGPGIGKDPLTRQALTDILKTFRNGERQAPPAVLDADALNLIAESNEKFALLPPNCIITPHPKEFDRLAGLSSNGYQRWLKQRALAEKYRIIIVLKGAYTCIASPDGACYFNATGNPGMATGGSGDVLTGIIVSLLAQGWEPVKAACAGVWIHGAAGDLSAEKYGQQAMTAGDIIECIGDTLKKLQPDNEFSG